MQKRVLTLSILLLMLSSNVIFAANHSDWATEDIMWATEHSLVADTDFKRAISREEYTELVMKLYDLLPSEKIEEGKEDDNKSDSADKNNGKNISDIVDKSSNTTNEEKLTNVPYVEDDEEMVEDEDGDGIPDEEDEEIEVNEEELYTEENYNPDEGAGEIKTGWDIPDSGTVSGNIQYYDQPEKVIELRVCDFVDTDKVLLW